MNADKEAGIVDGADPIGLLGGSKLDTSTLLDQYFKYVWLDSEPAVRFQAYQY